MQVSQWFKLTKAKHLVKAEYWFASASHSTIKGQRISEVNINFCNPEGAKLQAIMNATEARSLANQLNLMANASDRYLETGSNQLHLD